MLYVSAGAIEKCRPDKNKIKVICPSIWIHYVTSGAGYYNGGAVRAGEAFIVYKNDLCEYFPDENDPWTYVWIRLEGDDDEKILQKFGIMHGSGVFKFDYSERLLSLCRSILSEDILGGACRAYRESCAKMILSLNLKSEPEQIRAWDERWVNRAKEYISANYHKRITVEEIAESLYIDRQYLRNLFVKYTGVPTKVYLDNYRLRRALELLLLKDTSIAIIARSVGYTDQFAFSKAFKKRYGKAPSRYLTPDK